MELSRRQVLRALGAAGLLAMVPACSSPFARTRLTVATGGTRGVYFALGTASARTWHDRLGLADQPRLPATGGSVANLGPLASGDADVAFSQVDVATDRLAAPDGPHATRALTRSYDDVVHVVVRASSPIRTPADLRGARVSIGAEDSGVTCVVRGCRSAPRTPG